MKIKLISAILTVIVLSNCVLADSSRETESDYSTIMQYETKIEEYNRIAAEYDCTISIPEDKIIEFCNTVDEDELRNALSQLDVTEDEDSDLQAGGSGSKSSYTWTRTASLGVGVTLVAYITGTYNHNKVTSCTNVTSHATGLTLGDTYYQTSYTYSIASGGTSMTVHVYGKYNVNVILEGIGTIVTKNIHKTFTVTAP